MASKTHCLYVNGSSCRTWSEGGELGAAPKWKHNLGLRFETSVGEDFAFCARLNARFRSELAADRSDSPLDNATVATLPAVEVLRQQAFAAADPTNAYSPDTEPRIERVCRIVQRSRG